MQETMTRDLDAMPESNEAALLALPRYGGMLRPLTNIMAHASLLMITKNGFGTMDLPAYPPSHLQGPHHWSSLAS